MTTLECCGELMLMDSGLDSVSCAAAYFTLVDAGVPVLEYGRGIRVDNIDDPDLRAVAEHWIASHREEPNPEVAPAGRSLADDLERLAATSPDVQRADARSRARFKRLAGCTCTRFEDIDITYLDAGCPVHGRDAHPENWEGL